MVEGAVEACGGGVGADVGGAVAVGAGNGVEVGGEGSAGRELGEHLGGVVGLGGVLPVAAGAVLGGVEVGGLVPLVVGGNDPASAGVALGDGVVAGEGVGAGLGVAVVAGTVVEPVGHAHGIDGCDEEDGAVLAAFEDAVGVVALVALAQDLAAAGGHEVVGVGLAGDGVEEGGVLGVADLEPRDLEGVIDLASGGVPLGVLGVPGVADGDEVDAEPVGAGEAEALVGGCAALGDGVVGDGSGRDAGDVVALGAATTAGALGGGVHRLVPFP